MRGLYYALLALAGLGAWGLLPVAGAQVPDTFRIILPDTFGIALGDSFPDTLRLTLGEAARLAAERSALVTAAHYGTAGFRARRREVESALWPQLSAYLEAGERTINIETFGFPSTLFPNIGPVIGPIRIIDLRGQLRQTLFDWSLIQRLREARAEVSASELREEAVRDSVAGVAAAAYVQWLRAVGDLRARRVDLSLAEELLDIAEAQLAAGVGVRLDRTRAEAQVARTWAQLVGSETAAEQARLALLRAMDLPPWTTLLAQDTLGEPLAPVPAESDAIAVALEQRADLRAADAEIRAQRLQVAAIRAERLPFLTFEGDEGWIGTSLDELPRTYSWDFRVSIPIFNGWVRRARTQEQEANVKVLEARREELSRMVVYEVESALLELRAGAAQVDAALAGYEAAEVALARAQGLARDLP
jgi:outer membrane protein TolC